jgi:hypothetical protein
MPSGLNYTSPNEAFYRPLFNIIYIYFIENRMCLEFFITYFNLRINEIKR